MSRSVRLARFILVLTWCFPSLVFGIQFAGLLEDPALFVRVVCRLVRGAMDLARTIKYAVQAGWSLIVSFIWLLPLTGLRATESGVDRGVLGVVTVASTLVSVASGLAVAISGFRSARVACIVIATGWSAILTRTEAGHKCS